MGRAAGLSGWSRKNYLRSAEQTDLKNPIVYRLPLDETDTNGHLCRDPLAAVRLRPDPGQELLGSIEETLQDFGASTAQLILHQVNLRSGSSLREVLLAIEDLDTVLNTVLGTGRRIVLNHCAKTLSRRLGIGIKVETDKLADLAWQAMRIWRQSSIQREQTLSLSDDDSTNTPPGQIFTN